MLMSKQRQQINDHNIILNITLKISKILSRHSGKRLYDIDDYKSWPIKILIIFLNRSKFNIESNTTKSETLIRLTTQGSDINHKDLQQTLVKILKFELNNFKSLNKDKFYL